MKISAKSEKGVSRSINQDSYAAGELTGNVSWAVVCDGMGGAAGGNVASATASKLISEKITTCYHVGMSDNSIKNVCVIRSPLFRFLTNCDIMQLSTN